MKSFKLKFIGITFFTALILLGCNFLMPNNADQIKPDAIYTQAAQTVEAKFTQISEVWTATAAAVSPTIPSSPTPLPTNTPRPTKTPTLIPTPTQIPCNMAQFISDMTVPDGVTFTPQTQFTKVWRIKNIGSCTWTKEYNLVFFSGDKMGGNTLVAFHRSVKPGEYIDLVVELTSPNKPGTYLGNWLLRTTNGILFGLGNVDKTFWVEITVVEVDSNYTYDFAANICDARWNALNEGLYCQGADFGTNNFVQITDAPKFETGKIEDELALWMNVRKNNMVRGKFPSIEVTNGDHFIAEIGCTFMSEDCNVKFILAYRIIGSDEIVYLGSWIEKYDNKTTIIDIDLSSLAGEFVEFTLSVKSRSSSNENQVYWFVPGIQ